MRQLPVILVLLFTLSVSDLAAAPASPAVPPAPAGEGTLPPELQAELNSLAARWHPSATLRASVGWRDNVLLSPFAPIDRAFGRAEVEAMLLRPMHEHWEFLSFVSGDVLRYFSPPTETAGEQQWALHAEGRWQPLEPLRVSLKGAGYFRDMVVDFSETEARREVAPTRVYGGYAMAATRALLPGGFAFEPSIQVRRTDYREYAGDHEEVRSGGRLEWERGSALAISVAGFEGRRDYDKRPNYSASGRVLPGTHLKFRLRDGEVRVRTGGIRVDGEWNVAATVGRLENRDEASGYFDYDQERARLELGWEGVLWRVGLDGEAKRTEYRIQTVGSGITPPPRRADDTAATLRVERLLTNRWTLFAENHWERSRSNEREFSYRMNTVLAGVQREF